MGMGPKLALSRKRMTGEQETGEILRDRAIRRLRV
jgi:hypothetical protein